MKEKNDFINNLISKMTLDEKVGQVNQKLYGWEIFEKVEDDYILTDKFKEHVKWGGGIGAIYGLFRADPWSQINYDNGIAKEDSFRVTEMIQDYIRDETRLKIPVLFSEECPHGHQALDGEIYPSNIGIGATWNRELVKEMASNIAEEISSKGAHLGLISTLDMLRDPRWGRSEECYSEDPYIAAEFTENVVNGMQGIRDKDNFIADNKIASVLKVIAAHGASEGGLNSAASNIGIRELREIHLPAIKAGAKAGALGAMAAYNEIDGIPCHANENLMSDIIKNEFGFEGLIMADGGALDRLDLMTNDKHQSANLGLNAGIDLSLWDDAYTNIVDGVNNGIINEKILDRAVYRILNVKYEMGLFNKKRKQNVYNTQKHIETNEQIAEEAIVLLKNEDNILPLNSSAKRIAVIGPNADTFYNQLGDYTPPKKEGEVVTVLDGIKAAVSEKTIVDYAKGCEVRNMSKEGFSEAIKLAKIADYVVLVLGGSSARNFDMKFHDNGAVISSSRHIEMNSGENVDLSNLDLDGVQNDLFEEILKVNKNIVTVLVQGRPHTIENIKEASKGIMSAWYPGQRGGTSVAKVLFGLRSPSGRLAVSIPRTVGQLPVFYNKKNDGSKQDYADLTGDASYPFGYGLSYTTFDYTNINISRTEIKKKDLEKGEKFKVCVDVTNKGDIDAKEVIQLYTKDLEASAIPRVMELKGFEKKNIKTKETVTFEIEVGEHELSVYNHALEFELQKGKVIFMVGKSSKDILKEFTIEIL